MKKFIISLIGVAVLAVTAAPASAHPMSCRAHEAPDAKPLYERGFHCYQLPGWRYQEKGRVRYFKITRRVYWYKDIVMTAHPHSCGFLGSATCGPEWRIGVMKLKIIR